jgi:excisionase family DNA binding protein
VEDDALADDAVLMTLDQLAAYLQVDPQTVMRLTRQGKIPSHKVGKQFRFLRSAVLKALLHQPRHRSPPEEPTPFIPEKTMIRARRIGRVRRYRKPY